MAYISIYRKVPNPNIQWLNVLLQNNKAIRPQFFETNLFIHLIMKFISFDYSPQLNIHKMINITQLIRKLHENLRLQKLSIKLNLLKNPTITKSQQYNT